MVRRRPQQRRGRHHQVRVQHLVGPAVNHVFVALDVSAGREHEHQAHHQRAHRRRAAARRLDHRVHRQRALRTARPIHRRANRACRPMHQHAAAAWSAPAASLRRRRTRTTIPTPEGEYCISSTLASSSAAPSVARPHPSADSRCRDSMLCSARIGSRYDAARAGNHAPAIEAATPSPNDVSTRSRVQPAAPPRSRRSRIPKPPPCPSPGPPRWPGSSLRQSPGTSRSRP